MLKTEKEILKNYLNSSEKLSRTIKRITLKKLQGLFGLNSSAKEVFISRLAEQTDKPLFIIINSQQLMLNFLDSLKNLTDKNVQLLDQTEQSPYELLYSDVSIFHQNRQKLKDFQNGKIDILLCSAKSLMDLYPNQKIFENFSIRLEKKQDINPYDLIKQLSSIGYRRVTMVSDAGEYSLRGDILDIFPSNTAPVRLEFWGDTIESIRHFSTESQRTTKHIKEISINPRYSVVLEQKNLENFKKNLDNAYSAQEKKLDNESTKDTLLHTYRSIIEDLDQNFYFEGIEYFAPYIENKFDTVFSYLPPETLIITVETPEILSKIELQHKKYTEEYNNSLNQGLLLPIPRLLHNDFENIEKYLAQYQRFYLDSFISDLFEFDDSIECEPAPKFGTDKDALINYIKQHRQKGNFTIISTTYPQRAAEILKENEIPYQNIKNLTAEIDCKDVLICNFELTEGFSSEDLKLTILTDTEFFNKKIKKTTVTKKLLNKEKAEYIENINDLKEGDYVVHLHHGIGRYLGLTKQEFDGEIKDYLTIEYARKDKLHIPAEQINFLSRYRGSGNQPPVLSKMGGDDWVKTKTKVQKAIEEVAQDLLLLYARRAKAEGIVYEQDSPWQIEMEDAFPYTETPDQLKAIEDTKSDMESQKVMDRLICGDVGFGKTEVAIRAIFKAVLSGKQVAMLVPTTILARQHYLNISERFKPYPMKVGLLSRFRTPKEQKQLIKDIETGEVDIVIGTHRLLQKDVHFKNLGLLVIDEEHRFGVKDKENLKQLKAEVDVLTLSATPIPRTLYMSLSGVRDMSLINSPPVNRAPIKTYVGEYNINYVKSAINHEIEREGQVYFLYNRVETIHQFADELRMHMPNINIAVAHGQMPPKELEEIMYAFSEGEYDVLLCTTIIESGLDIPNANTMIVYDADRFGLAQLYQIRGRVGRSERQAYAYCFYRPGKLLTKEASDRLNAIKDFTTLGSGYQIAMRDLEIRGVGHILGHKQHGHMISVGFDAYCQLLDEAIRELRGEKVEKITPPAVDINVTAYIPDEWVGDENQKMIEYKRLADVKNLRELTLIKEEWEDRFGKIPESVEILIKVIKIRLLATGIGINFIRETPSGIRIYTEYEQNEWKFLANHLDKKLLRLLKWTKAPESSKDAKSIIILNNSHMGTNELFAMLETLFYGINKIQNKLLDV